MNVEEKNIIIENGRMAERHRGLNPEIDSIRPTSHDIMTEESRERGLRVISVVNAYSITLFRCTTNWGILSCDPILW